MLQNTYEQPFPEEGHGQGKLMLQVLGSCCFITAAILFMLETQPSWWHIKPFDLGWHVGFWNLIGGLGFWLW